MRPTTKSRILMALTVLGLTLVGCSSPPLGGAGSRVAGSKTTTSAESSGNPAGRVTVADPPAPATTAVPLSNGPESPYPLEDLVKIMGGDQAVAWLKSAVPAGWEETPSQPGSWIFRVGHCEIGIRQIQNTQNYPEAEVVVDDSLAAFAEAKGLTSLVPKEEPLLMLQIAGTDLLVGVHGHSFTSNEAAGSYYAYVSGPYLLESFQICLIDDVERLESEIYPWLRTNQIKQG